MKTLWFFKFNFLNIRTSIILNTNHFKVFIPLIIVEEATKYIKATYKNLYFKIYLL